MKLMQTALAGIVGALVAVSAQAADITGAGSTFAAPIYTKWADAYQKTGGGKVNYQGIGSSGGIKQIIAKTVDFAGSDAPLKDDELAKQGLFQFPTVVGGVVPAINVPGVKPGDVTLSGEVLGDIYLGKIKKWNDPAIVALNPKVKLPDTDIAVVRRADGSGTSFIWTNYLSKVNPEWKSKVGEGSTVNWPTGTGGKGNDGVAAFVQRLPGAIGYVEWAYAKQNKMTYVDLKNSAGRGRRAEDGNVQGSGSWRRLVEVVLPDPDERAGQGRMADRRRDLRAAAHDAGQGSARRRNAEVLRLGVQERHASGERPRLHLAAGFGRRGNPHAMESEGEGRVGQGRSRNKPASCSKVQ